MRSIPIAGHTVTLPIHYRFEPSSQAPVPLHNDGADELTRQTPLIVKPDDGTPSVHRRPERRSTSGDLRFG